MNQLLGPLVLFAAAVTLTPGPNVVLVTAWPQTSASAAPCRRRWASPFCFGTMVLATGLGLAGVVHAEPRLHISPTRPSYLQLVDGGPTRAVARPGVLVTVPSSSADKLGNGHNTVTGSRD